MSALRVLILTCVLSLVGACTYQRAPGRLSSDHATCQATCDYYEYCSGDEDSSRERACMRDCRSIFSEDGEIDRSSLLDLQRLECAELLSFIEGDNSRPLGTSVTSASAEVEPVASAAGQ